MDTNDPYLTADDKARRLVIQAAWNAYDDLFTKPLIIGKDEPDDNVISNRCMSIVDTGVTFLFANKLEIQVKQDKSSALPNLKSPVQAKLEAAWGDEGRRMTFLTKLGMNGAVAGHVFVKIIPPDQTGDGLPRLVNLDPLCMTMQTKPDDCDVILSYSHEYQGTDPLSGAAILMREVTTRVDPDHKSDTGYGDDLDSHWEIQQWTKQIQEGAQWVKVGEPIIWPFDWSPIHDAQNLPYPNKAWGKSDLTPGIIQQNNTLNFVQSNTNRIIHKHAHPWPWASGTTDKTISISPGKVICLPNPDARMGLLEMISDLHSSREFAADIRGDMDEQSGVPAVAVGRISEIIKGQVSGIAIKLMFAPLLAKTEKKRRLYGDLIADLSSHMLELLDFGPDIKVELHWEAALPEDVLAEVQAAVLLDQLGVSKDTLLARMGFNPDEEAEKKAAEDANALKMFGKGQGMPPAQLAPPAVQPAQPKEPSVSGGLPAPAPGQPQPAPVGA